MVDLTGSIVLYKNDSKVLLEAVNSFLNTKLNVRLFLIDNSPSSNLKCHFNDDRIIYLHNPSNPGFGASHNIAIKKSTCFDSKYHVVINPDVYFQSGTLEKLLDFMDKNLKIGLVMPKVLSPSGSFQYLCKTNPTFFDLFARGFLPKFIKKVFSKRMDKFEYRGHDFSKIIYDIPYLSGCFMFFRTDILFKVKLFDEKFFMYLEDADVTRRVLSISRTAYFPEAIIFHHYSGLTHKKLKFKFITIQSAVIYFNKWGWFKHLI